MPLIKKTKTTKSWRSHSYYAASATIANDPNKMVSKVELVITNTRQVIQMRNLPTTLLNYALRNEWNASMFKNTNS